MSVAEQIERLQNAKTKLKTDLISKGLSSSNTDKLDVLVDKVPLTYTKAYFDTCVSASNLFNTSSAFKKFINMEDLQYDDTANVRMFFQTFVGCSKVVPLNTSSGIEFLSMYWGSTCSEFPDIDTSKAHGITSMYSNCKNAVKVPKLNIPNVTGAWSTFAECHKLPIIEFENWNLKRTYDDATTNVGSMFSNCYSLRALVIRSFYHGTSNQGKGFATSNLNGCYHFHGTVDATYNPNGAKDGYIYVPRANVEQLKTLTGWSTFSSQLRALEDFTVDGTTTGALIGGLY